MVKLLLLDNINYNCQFDSINITVIDSSIYIFKA